MAARLKVFAARLGFFDTVVAASSQKAALAAWGVHQDLFKDGSAQVTDEPAAQVALDQPGTVLRRAVGSSGTYSAEAPASVPATSRKAAVKKAKPPPDRGPLDRAEAALASAEARHHAEAAEISDRIAALQDELERLETRWAELAAHLQADVSAARSKYEKAGGRPAPAVHMASRVSAGASEP